MVPNPTAVHGGSTVRIFIDCTFTYTNGKNTGIERVVRNFVKHAAVLGPSLGVTCQPIIVMEGVVLPVDSLSDSSMRRFACPARVCMNSVYLTIARRLASILPFPPVQRFLLAHRSEFGLAWFVFTPLRLLSWLRFTGKSLFSQRKGIEESMEAGDILFLPDSTWSVNVFGLLERVKAKGVHVVFFVNDIIPLTHPHVYLQVHVERFRQWFEQVVRTADLIICCSQSTQNSISNFVGQHHFQADATEVVHLGCDFGLSPTGCMQHGDLSRALTKSSGSFICVGTLEPRKNLDIVIDAFEALWNDGIKVSLILIGRAGWLCEDLLIRIRQHPESSHRLFWFNDVGDTDLVLAYRKATALIFPSVVEGFGLPLVEALSQGLPVIASDIEVFREIAGEHVRYFPPHDMQALVRTVNEQLSECSRAAPSLFQWPTWEESTRKLLLTLGAFSVRQSGRG